MENQHQKWVNLSYLAVAILFGYLVFSLTGKLVGAYDLETRIRSIDLFMRVGSVVAGALLFIGLYRNEKANEFMNEVVSELSKVAWPTEKETSSATMIVIVMVVISGIILGLLDYFWVQILKWIL
jgi:preprotein translocase subunit SecE